MQPEWLQKPLVLKDALSDLPPVSMLLKDVCALYESLFL